MICPGCDRHLAPRGELLTCKACHGSFVPHALFTRLTGEKVPPPSVRRGVAFERACPVCSEGMAPVRVHGVPLDDCVKHGVWVDHAELEHGEGELVQSLAKLIS